jgi:hypothetical protein
MSCLASHQRAWAAVASIFVLTATVWCQTKQNQDLTRNDIVIERDRPTVYICADTNLMKKNKGDDLWLRINNNTRWTIRFKSDRVGTKPQLYKLPTGKGVAALSKDSVAFPQYEIESKRTRQSDSLWGDVGTFSWLLSGNSTVFTVPKRYFKDNLLYIEFAYAWEFVETVGRESHAPQHRVYFSVFDSNDLSGSACY